MVFIVFEARGGNGRNEIYFNCIGVCSTDILDDGYGPDDVVESYSDSNFFSNANIFKICNSDGYYYGKREDFKLISGENVNDIYRGYVVEEFSDENLMGYHYYE